MHSECLQARLGVQGQRRPVAVSKRQFTHQSLNNYSDRASQPAKLFDDGGPSKVQYDSRAQSESFPTKKGVTLALVTI